MEDESISERFKKRFGLFGQFFKGFVKPSDKENFSQENINPGEVHPHFHKDVYDDSSKYSDQQILEFKGPDQRNVEENPQLREIERHGRREPIPSIFSIFDSARSFMDEFEHIAKVFDDFSSNFNQTTIFMDPSQAIEGFFENDEDEQEARYYRFFGKDLNEFRTPNVIQDSEHYSTNSDPKTEPDANYRDMMLKRPERNLEHDGIDEVNRHSRQSSLLSKVLDSFWRSPAIGPLERDGFGSGSGRIFTFSKDQSSFTSDGIKVTATKIRETPAGREIIKYRTNEKGETEETREFIPRKDLPPSSNQPSTFGNGIFGLPPRL